MAFSFGTSFGAPQNPGLSFGAPATTQPSLFGTSATQQSAGNLFATPASAAPATGLFGAPAATTASTGFSFGTPATSVPAFGTPNLFGTTTTPAAAPTSLTLGTPQNTSFSFGASASTATPKLGLSFGTPASTATGLSFGTPASTATGLSFGTPASTATGLSFGTPASTATGLSFGTPASTATGLSLGAPITTSAGFSFSTPAATSAPGFSLGAPTTASTAFPLGGTTTPSLGLSFGTTAAVPTLNFGTATSTPGTGLNFGFGATSASATTSGLSFGLGNATTITTSAPVGLGGIASTTPSLNSSTAKTEQAPKDQTLPNEIQQTVDAFKEFVKQQKGYSSDVARCSVKEFKKVEANIDAVNNLLNEVEKQLHMNKSTVEKLKYDTARVLQQVEIAQRTYDTPMGLQYDNNAPTQFFMELVDIFEREMQNMKLQIENTEKYFKNVEGATPLGSQELMLGMRRIHETFVALAGRLQSVHSQVEAQKEQYLSLRRHMLNDTKNIFEKTNNESDAFNLALINFNLQTPKIGMGPTPFNSLSNPSIIQNTAQNNPPSIFQQNNPFGTNTGYSFPSMNLTPSNTSLFGNTTTFGQTNQSTGFQLQKPPIGNKRGKQ